MARVYRITQPPPSGNAMLDAWLSRVAGVLNEMPATSIFSGNPNTSNVTAAAGTFGVDIGSSGSRWWVNVDGTSSGWSNLIY